MSKCTRHKEIGASANVFNQSLSLKPLLNQRSKITKVTIFMRAPGGEAPG